MANLISKHNREIIMIQEEMNRLKLIVLNMEDQLKNVKTSLHDFNNSIDSNGENYVENLI